MRILPLLAALLLPGVLLAQQVPIGGTPPDPEKDKARAVDRAKTELSAALKVPESRLDLVSATAATWGDTSLGCPEKDRMYAQVLTSGWSVVLKLEDRRHEVHVAGKRAVICPGKPAEKK